MRKQTGLTRIDLVVSLVCAAFLLATVQVYSSSGRGHAKLNVCLANMRALTAAWSMYADDHQDRIPCADIYYSREEMITRPPSDWTEVAGPGWYEWPHEWNPPPCEFLTLKWNSTEEDWKHAITDGSLWQYIQDYGIYNCPAGNNNEYVTYSIAHSMNSWCEGNQPFGPICDSGEIRTKAQILKPAERMVFIDEGRASTGSFAIRYDEPKFHDIPPKQHGSGTTVSFADGHSEYWKWLDKRTITVKEIECYGNALPWGANSIEPDQTTCNLDLIRLQKAVWGKLGYALPPDCNQ